MARRWGWVLWAVVLAAPAWAVVTATPVFVQTPKAAVTVASTTVQTTIYTGGSNGSKVVGLLLTNTTGSASTATCQLKIGATAVTFLVISVVANAGTATGIPAVNAFLGVNTPGLPVDSDGNPFLYLNSASDTVQCASSASAALSYVVIAADF